MDPDIVLYTKHCTGRNYLLNVVRDNERRRIVRDIVETLPDNMHRLYYLRYEKDMTQQAIANVEGVYKMAICKRLKKLHEKVKAALLDWPEGEVSMLIKSKQAYVRFIFQRVCLPSAWIQKVSHITEN